MSKISTAILDTLLESITDYQLVKLSVTEYEELEEICFKWGDKESIETEINIFLAKNSYFYDSNDNLWHKYFTAKELQDDDEERFVEVVMTFEPSGDVKSYTIAEHVADMIIETMDNE